jgi:hypothetical protein
MGHLNDLVHMRLKTSWGAVLILRPLPRGGDCWGILAPLKDTFWGEHIAVVSGEALTHALHGYTEPLMREIGPSPEYLLRRMPHHMDKVVCQLALDRSCGMADKNCFPCSEVPECYTPILPPGTQNGADISNLILAVVLAWKEGRYVIVAEGKEFSR